MKEKRKCGTMVSDVRKIDFGNRRRKKEINRIRQSCTMA